MAEIQYCKSCLLGTKSVNTLYNIKMIQLIDSNNMIVIFQRFQI